MTDDLFARTRALFDLPEGVIYLDGNSLGAMPKAARERVRRELDENWGRELIRAWNTAGWIDMPSRIGDRIGALIGAPAGSVMAADSTSVNLYKALNAALRLAGPRKTILSDSGNFPTDLYIAEGVIGTLDRGYQLKVVAPEEVAEAMDETVAVLMLTEVDYRTGRLHDMAALTAKREGAGHCHDLGPRAFRRGAAGRSLLASAPISPWVAATNISTAVPAPPRSSTCVLVCRTRSRRSCRAGWVTRPRSNSISTTGPRPRSHRLRAGTPAVLSMAALEAALTVWDGVDMAAVRARSIALGEAFIQTVELLCPELELASPRDPQRRGSQVSFRFAHGYEVMQALIAEEIIGDFRAPDIMRFGFTPLYLSPGEVEAAARRLAAVINQGLWDQPKFRARNKVT